MIQLQEKELLKLSELTEVPLQYLEKLYAMRILNEALTCDFIIRSDYEKILKKKIYKPSQIIFRLANKYCVTEGKVRSAIYRKQNRYYYCTKCQKRIPLSMYKRNNGICDTCMANQIEL